MLRTPARTAVMFAPLALAAFTAACENKGDLISPTPFIVSIAVTPNPHTMPVNSSQQFIATTTDNTGQTAVITPTWSVVAGGGTINSTGIFTGGGTAGTFPNTVRATSGSVSGTATVTLTNTAVLATLTIVPNPVTLAVGATQQFVAIGRDAAGNTISTTPVWSVVAGGGSIGVGGLFTAGTTTGTFTNTIQATSGGLTANATVTVVAGALATLVITPNPASMGVFTTQQFTAVGRDANGNVVAVTPAWSIVAGGGTINGTGMFTAGGTTGTFTNTVRATSGGLSATATVIVTEGTLATITVVPNPAILATGASQQFVAIGRDAGGNTVALTPTWSVVAGGGVINVASGMFTAGNALGTFTNTVQATSGGISGNATVTVIGGPLFRIDITPNPATVPVNGTQQFVATGRDANGNIVPISGVWSVTQGGGTINPATGLFTAGVNTGSFPNTVRVVSGQVAANATVNVTAGALFSITVTPDPDTLAAGSARTFTAVGRDANGNVVAITPTWSVENGGGTINPNTGRFTAGLVAGTFNNTVRATSGGVSGRATVTVTPVGLVLASITVTPDPANLGTNNSRNFTATGRDAAGNIMPIVPVWSVVNGGGTINSVTGRFTAGNNTGTFNNTVRATVGAIFGSATVNVTDNLIPLGQAAPNGIMAGTAVTCVALGIINADVSISPGNTLNGFGPCLITGDTHLADAVAAQAQIDLTTAYNTLFGLPCSPSNAIVANLGGTTKPAGVYCTATGIGVTGTLTLDGGGNPNAVFVFQAGTSLITAGNVVLINGAQAKNVYWVVGSSATIGTASHWQGNIIALTSITLVDNATLIGRALARNGAVTLGTNNVITLP